MKTTYIGRQAEDAVAKKLLQSKHRVIAQNWRRPHCEIDIISSKNKVIFFCEVKYRSESLQGEGFDYITPRKVSQIVRAAKFWCAENNYEGDWRLLAASVSGESFENIELVEFN